MNVTLTNLSHFVKLLHYNGKHSRDTFINKRLQVLDCFLIIQVQTEFILNLRKKLTKLITHAKKKKLGLILTKKPQML